MAQLAPTQFELREHAEKFATDMKESCKLRSHQQRTLEIVSDSLVMTGFTSTGKWYNIIMLATARHTKARGLEFEHVSPLLSDDDYDAWCQMFRDAFEKVSP